MLSWLLPPLPAPGDLPMFRDDDLTIVLNGALSGSTGAFELVFPVESVAAVRKQVTDRGCHFTGKPREVAKGMWAATLTDPDGHRLALFGARLSSGSANRPYAALSVNDASRKTGYGSISATPMASVYSATKAAVDAITVSLAGELGPKKIRVNSINPGMVETEGLHSVGFAESDFRKHTEATTPLGRIAQPQDIATAAVFFASDDAGWVTGQTLLLTGGARQ
jgi:NAD(P)-dependent dehydrogenase (short-subunit alcohol dehydrogenase family)